MSIRVKTADGKEEISVKFSKLTTTVEILKHEIEKKMHIKTDLQRLFFAGKQLENDYYLYHYNININDVILLVVNVENKVTPKKSTKEKANSKNKVTPEKNTKEKLNEDEENLEKANSQYYLVGDAVDCQSREDNAWFEAIIKNIYLKEGEMLYEILWEFRKDTCCEEKVPETRIRPRSRYVIPPNELSIDQQVLINYDISKPGDIGHWFDFTITNIVKYRRSYELTGRLHLSSNNELCIQKKYYHIKVYRIEAPKLLTQRTDEHDKEQYTSSGRSRPMPPDCKECMDNPYEQCNSCGCNICAGKEEESTLLICDECEFLYHMKCLNPPLVQLPPGNWYCPECKRDKNEIVKAGDKLKKIKDRLIDKNRNLGLMMKNIGSGMANAGRQKICYIVPPNHIGPIPNVDVGTTWLFRLQVSEAGVHRPAVAGIHGRASECAFSIVFSGGYKDDYDDGDEFIYSGSGGRDLSGNKRVSTQCKDQKLTAMNLALAKNCNAPLNIEHGADAKSNWREGIPVRVVRNYKLKKLSAYAPDEGNRYDGMYKVVKYYPDKKSTGYVMWKYVLRRDDSNPAPWTKEGKNRIAYLGLKMIYPDGYLAPMKKSNNTATKKRRAIHEDNKEDDEEDDVATRKPKGTKKIFDLEDKLKNLIKEDAVNAKLWDECQAKLIDGKPAFLNCVSERFNCVCCIAILYKPVTTPCDHNICLKCLKRSFKSENYFCPICRYHLGEDYDMKINKPLSSALLLIFPGYKGEQ